MAMMVKNMKNGEPTPWLDMVIETSSSFGKISSIFDENYDGGEFCKGLLLAKEASFVISKLGSKIMSQGNKPSASQSSNPAVEHASYSGVKTHHSNLQAPRSSINKLAI